ncbi:hypothetical protein N7463_001475 [Penicillium fimorum]|uniref:Protein kinase domain-containing protein n=1 Tax=Penicillium fimorum TaxID=1882269 RepID=A0A9X0CCX1_9EURO|nr:hypothetical protein N7463_001475 [Penicillium fimorum]
MSRVPDCVLDSKLVTDFSLSNKYETVHIYHGPESSSQRPVEKVEHWQREKKIGGGGFGEVWLERCTKGEKQGHQVRAIKEITVHRQKYYARELEAITKFSHPKACLPAAQCNEIH